VEFQLITDVLFFFIFKVNLILQLHGEMGFGAISVLFTSPMTILVIGKRKRGKEKEKNSEKGFSVQ